MRQLNRIISSRPQFIRFKKNLTMLTFTQVDGLLERLHWVLLKEFGVVLTNADSYDLLSALDKILLRLVVEKIEKARP